MSLRITYAVFPLQFFKLGFTFREFRLRSGSILFRGHVVQNDDVALLEMKAI